MKEERKGGSICALELQYDNRDTNSRDESSSPSYGFGNITNYTKQFPMYSITGILPQQIAVSNFCNLQNNSGECY